jgi:hypothetical protein
VGLSIVIRSRMFTPDMSQRASEEALDICLDALVRIDLLWLRLNPTTPRLRDSGVRYYHEGIKDEWYDIGAALHDQVADCKGLAAWRVAELRASGEDLAAATSKKFAVINDPSIGKLLLYHIQVTRGDGSVEDPSRETGMGGVEPDGYLPVPGVAWAVANAMTHNIGAAMLGNPRALEVLQELQERANRGDRLAYYLRGVARDIVASGYDPRKTKFVRHDDGSFEWVYPHEVDGTRHVLAPHTSAGLESRQGGTQGGR